MVDLAAVDLNLLVALDLLLEERSVRGAARRAHVTPSAMSHTLGRLRDLLGDEVLVRAGRRMVPTPRSEELVEPVRELLERARAVLTPPGRFDPSGIARRFRLVCTDHVSTVLLGPVEHLLAERAPGVDLLVAPLVPETMEDLRSGGVDAAIGVFPDAVPELRARRLFEDTFVTVCRVDHPRLGGVELDLAAFLLENHVLVAPRGGSEGLVDRLLARTGHARRVSRTFPSFLAALWHVARTDALLTVSRRLVEAVGETLPLVVHAVPIPLEPYVLRLAWHPRNDAAADQAWLRGILVEVAEGLP